MTLPAYIGAGASVSGTGGVTPSLPAGWQQDDVFLLVTENMENAAPATPVGWTLLGSQRQGVINFSRLSLYWRRATASETDPVSIADPGDHLLAQIFAFRDAERNATPFALGAFAGANSGTAWTAPGVTTTMDDCLIVLVGSNDADNASGQFPNAFANANLANVTTRSNIGTAAGGGGSLCVATGEKATAGATGSSTTTMNTSLPWNGVHVILLPLATIAGALSVAEAVDFVSASAMLPIAAIMASIEAHDGLSAAASLRLAASLAAVEADDELTAASDLAVEAALTRVEEPDGISASAALPISGAVQGAELDDAVSSSGALAIAAALAQAEADDTVSADTFLGRMPELHRRGGDDDWRRHERERQWQQDLRRIIDEAWLIANGEIDPVTRQEIVPAPPPDYSAIQAALAAIERDVDGQRMGAFIARQEHRQEDEAVALLLIAA